MRWVVMIVKNWLCCEYVQSKFFCTKSELFRLDEMALDHHNRPHNTTCVSQGHRQRVGSACGRESLNLTVFPVQ